MQRRIAFVFGLLLLAALAVALWNNEEVEGPASSPTANASLPTADETETSPTRVTPSTAEFLAPWIAAGLASDPTAAPKPLADRSAIVAGRIAWRGDANPLVGARD